MLPARTGSGFNLFLFLVFGNEKFKVGSVLVFIFVIVLEYHNPSGRVEVPGENRFTVFVGRFTKTGNFNQITHLLILVL